MKVILLQDIKGLGRKWDVKDVSDGYVRNLLLPRRLVEIATSDSLKKILGIKSAMEERHKKLLVHLKEQAKELESLKLTFKLRAGAKGETFGSVTSHDIEKELQSREYISAKAMLDKPIKKTGIHTVPVSLGEGIESNITVSVEEQ